MASQNAVAKILTEMLELSKRKLALTEQCHRLVMFAKEKCPLLAEAIKSSNALEPLQEAKASESAVLPVESATSVASVVIEDDGSPD
jgi:hypothetical protein